MRVFLSYTRLKDQFNKVSEFCERLQQELELRDPGSQVFQDKKNLQEGQHFPEVLEAAISEADVFLALVSPAWLLSEWCRQEFGLFTSQATDSSRLHRIVPVLWVETPEMRSNSLDLIARTIAPINYSDWRDLRYERWEEPAVQRLVGRLAESVLALARSPATHTATPNATSPTYRFKYGIRWTDDGTPLCNRCGVPITSMMWAAHFEGQVRSLRCSCNKLPIVLLHGGQPVHADDAMREMANTL